MKVFLSDPSHAHRRRAAARREIPLRSDANLTAFWQKMALKTECPLCGVETEQSCESVAKATPGIEISPHHQRITLARKKFGKKSPQQGIHHEPA